MAKKTPGLYRRNGLWHIDKQIKGYGRLCETTGECHLEQAERYLATRLERIRQTSVYGIRPTRTLVEAATKYLEENLANRAIQREADALNDDHEVCRSAHAARADSRWNLRLLQKSTAGCRAFRGNDQPRSCARTPNA